MEENKREDKPFRNLSVTYIDPLFSKAVVKVNKEAEERKLQDEVEKIADDEKSKEDDKSE